MSDRIIIDPITHDPQEAYEIIRAHFTKPGAQLSFHVEKFHDYNKVTERVVCDYRGPNGAMCAFGVLIPDDQYREEMEGEKASMFLTHETENFARFVQHAQWAHDDTATLEEGVEEFIVRLDKVAEEFNLTRPA